MIDNGVHMKVRMSVDSIGTKGISSKHVAGGVRHIETPSLVTSECGGKKAGGVTKGEGCGESGGRRHEDTDSE